MVVSFTNSYLYLFVNGVFDLKLDVVVAMEHFVVVIVAL